MPKISVIVPVYNAEKYLANCLESLLNQTFKDIEIICVNDGSTDKSLEILNQYSIKDSRVKVYSQENKGVAEARNTAIKYASGIWLAFCDSDDTVPLRAYQHLYAKTDDVDIVIGEYYEINDYGRQTRIKKRGKFKHNLFYAIFQMPTVWTKLIKKSFIQKYQLRFQNVIVGEDFIFLAECVSQMPSYTVVNQPVYYYWEHNKEKRRSLTHEYDLIHFRGHLNCRNVLYHICWEKYHMQEAYSYLYFDTFMYPLEYMFRIQDFNEKKEAFELFKQYLNNFDWVNEQDRFSNMMGMPYETFMDASAMQYFSETTILKAEEYVLSRYEAGTLGFRYILKYIGAWMKFKWKLFRMEHKK